MSDDGAGTPEGPVLSVILITRNGADRIEVQLRALLRQEWERSWELVVLDNGSTDETPQVVDRMLAAFGNARRVRFSERQSVAAARNAGVRAARGEFVAVVDDDDRVGDGWLAAIGDAVRAHGFVAARVDLTVINDPVVARGRRKPAQSERIDDWFGIPVASGATIAVRRDWFDRVGGNDERLPAAEDIDFCIRLHRDLGVSPVFAPDAVYHYRLRSHPVEAFRQGRHYGRVDPVLFARHRSVLPRRPSWQEPVKEWARLLATAPLTAFDRSRRLRWCYRAGIRVGRIEGSIRHRVVFL